MHILAIAIGVLGAILFLLWRLGVIFRRGQQVIEAANDAGAAIRRHRWRQQAKPRAIEEIDDPKLAAAVILVLVLRIEGDLTAEDRENAAREMARVFESDLDDGQSLLAEAIFATSEVTDELRWTRKLSRLLVEACTRAELIEVVEMIVASARDCKLTDRQRVVMDQFKSAAGLD